MNRRDNLRDLCFDESVCPAWIRDFRMFLIHNILLFCSCIGATFAIPRADTVVPRGAQSNDSSPLTLDDPQLLEELFLISSNNDTWTNSSLSAYDPSIKSIKCLSDRPGTERWQRILVDDYFEAVEKILLLDQAMTFKIQRLPLGSLPVAEHDTARIAWVSLVTIPVVTPRFQPVFLAHVSALIVRECVTNEKRFLGGAAVLWTTGLGLMVANPNRAPAVATSAGDVQTS